MNRITEYILTPIHCVSGYAICIYTGRVVRRLLPGMLAGGGARARTSYLAAADLAQATQHSQGAPFWIPGQSQHHVKPSNQDSRVTQGAALLPHGPWPRTVVGTVPRTVVKT